MGNKCRDLKSDHDNLSNEKEDALNVIFKENKEILLNNEKLKTLISTLQNDNKHLKEKNIEYEKQNNVIVSDVAKLKRECDCNNKTIIVLTTEKDAAIEMNDKLSETKDAKVEEIDKLVIDNNTLETKVTNTELLLLAKEEELEEKELELNQSSQYGSEKDSGLKIAEVRIKSLEDDLSNLESIKIEIEDKNVEHEKINEELRQELENLGNERGELQNKLESTDGIIRDLRVEVDGLNIVVDENSQQYNIELQKSADAFSSNEEFSTSISTLQNENKHLQEERLEYEKTMIEKTVELENEINVLVSDVAELKSECDCNNKTIIDLTAEKDAAIEMNDKLSETKDAKVEEIDKLVMDNNTLETNVTHTELLLLAKEEELDEKELELNQSSQYGSEKDSGLKIAEVRIKSLEDDLSNIESIKLEIEQKNVEHEKINEELRQELENLGNERGELQNKLESTDGVIRDLRVEVDGLNIVVDENS